MQLKLLNYCLNALIASTVLFSALAPVQAADKKSNILISLREAQERAFRQLESHHVRPKGAREASSGQCRGGSDGTNGFDYDVIRNCKLFPQYSKSL